MYIRIYQEKKSATQSAHPKNVWILEFITDPSTSYVNPEMHWNASYDIHKQIKLKFETFDEVKEYAESHAIPIKTITNMCDSKDKKINKKSYLQNFQEIVIK